MQSAWICYHLTVCRVSPETGASSAALDDDLVTDRLAGQLRQEQELEEPITASGQSTEQQQEQQQEQEDEERKARTSCNSFMHIIHHN